MKSNDKFKKYVKDCIFYHFDGIVKIEDFDLYNIFIDEKSYQNSLDYNISYKNLIAGKPLRIRFDKIDGNFRVYNGTRYLVLFESEKYDFIQNRIRYSI